MGPKCQLVYDWMQRDCGSLLTGDRIILAAWNSLTFLFSFLSLGFWLCVKWNRRIWCQILILISYWLSPFHLKLKEERCQFCFHYGWQLLPASWSRISDSKIASGSFRKRIAGDKWVVLIWVRVVFSPIHSLGIAVSFPSPPCVRACISPPFSWRVLQSRHW